MPTVDVNPDELRRLTGHDEKSDDELKEDMFGLGLEFEGETEDGDMQLEFAPDRLDRLSIEGVARSLRYQYGDDTGVYVPKTNDPDWTIEVDESVPDERPYVTGAIVRGLNLNEEALDSLIQLQEKLHATMGRKRAKGAIGIHDLTMLKGRDARSASERASGVSGSEATGGSEARRASGEAASQPASEDGSNSIRYVGVDPDGDRFVPLDSDAEMTPEEVLRAHPTGEKYADLVSEYDRYPAIYDDIGLFSFPPVINGRRTEVETESRDLFIELTGTDQWTIDKMCAIICYALDARGGTIEEVAVEYDDRTLVRPDFEVTTKTVTHDRIETLLGIEFTPDEVVELLARSGLSGEAEEAEDGTVTYEVEIPPYRVDVLHPVDIVDDIGRAYGFNDLSPRYPDVGTVGGRHERSQLEDAAREVLVGLGFEDLLNFHMISEEENYERMRVEPGTDVIGGGTPAAIKNPYSEDYTMLRTWALPSLMMVLENNTHRTYPQDLTEIGLAARVDESENTGVAEHRTVAGVLARHDASYEDAKARLQAVARNFDVGLETPPTEHPTFITGRAASVVIDGETVGVIGEIHPEVLVEHDLEVPVTGFEFRLDALE
ncbi:phenylalanine--tRNA ligase subunit beta [Haladaptatus sp. W1]|uniref:phenylalanine--tRNA ligase subunit beta n=1 Tax=Haladaptatus sp. W1 TaxID=1897478 RepID=UPI0008499CE6|nr:phenylalanine--tRNA ligase subunit beta [Haladaptatus sp. W1]ODR79782.1 phenylalanine--tRNA ligase subunit beta [Haladaptatus sp. W1]